MAEVWRPELAQFAGPKYLALSHALRAAVRSGELPEGAKLPPVRELAWQLGITPGTVARAYQIGTQDGLLEAVVGRGTFVAARNPRLGPTQPLFSDAPALPDRADGPVDLRAPQLPDAGHSQAFARILSEMVREGCDWRSYPTNRRDLPLRRAFADWLSDRSLGTFDADDLVLTHGGQNAVGLVMQCCLRGERPSVLCEELAFPGFRRAARMNRADVVAVPLDAEGIVPEAFDAACRRTGARLLCVTPEAQNPTAGRMSLERRRRIAEIAAIHDVQIIEDDCYSVAEPSAPAIRALAPDRTWYVTSLSKSVSAGLRVGAIVCPTGHGESGRIAAQHSYFGLALPLAQIALKLFTTGEAVRLRDAGQAVFAQRLELLLNILGRHEMRWQKGLSFVWLPLPRGWRGSTFAREAEAAGVLVRSADEYALVDGHAPNAVRIALDAEADEPRFTSAIATLARLLDNPPAAIPV
ncbi:PLP-dependent aminotransferase family protein [Defluviimonas sp. WL0002]|uniref:PLP-dependent aminotransferase family protein n=1 Tax=Albidovulum marisflavi TaxID=2984159 RepID=A0ABT2ZHC4_9RHOB|nr:PLP-dependent aminotransferase family protein [Defluviimonas sp. WL0002]MCV2870522.1 PLP-dependent aminotransferase family protein [Defluviimonas sp. WL0002]